MATRRRAMAIGLAACLGGGAVLGAACGSRTGLDLVDESSSRDAGAGSDGPPVHVGSRLDCAEAGITYIYTIASDNQIYSFYPTTGEFTLIGTLDCPAPVDTFPFSMAVDHTGTAYVVFDDPNDRNAPGTGALYKVSTKTAECVATPFVPSQHGFVTFGMAFVANVGDGGTGETLFVAGDSTEALATIDLDTFTLHEVAPFQAGPGNMVSKAELTGTGDGRLFGFFAPDNGNPPSFIDRIDPKTARVLSSVLLPDVEEGNGWAFGFWGGDFYTFTAPDLTSVVTRYRPSDGSVTPVATAPFGAMIVGAGVSTCAPQQ